MNAPKILPATAYALTDQAGTVQSVYLHHNAAMDAVGRARGGVVEDLITRSQVRALELEVARLRDRENITSGELITGDELASGMQALRARLAEIELAEELAEDIIEAQRAVVQQLASQTTCDWPGKCRHQRPASAAAPERAEPVADLEALVAEMLAAQRDEARAERDKLAAELRELRKEVAR